jgi:hypothetical protein
MGCNCKADKLDAEILKKDKVKAPLPSVGTYIFKVLAFILMVAALPIINLFIIWFIFRTLVLNREVDIKPLLYAIGAKFKTNEDEEDEEDDYNTLTEDDVELVDVEDITYKSK